jgi:small subunit ribosomal protein S17
MPKRILEGKVISSKMNKTVTVIVERRFTHPVLKKTVRRSKHYHAHDENNVYKVGEIVRIQECRPISKMKSWEVIERVAAAADAAVQH